MQSLITFSLGIFLFGFGQTAQASSVCVPALSDSSQVLKKYAEKDTRGIFIIPYEPTKEGIANSGISDREYLYIAQNKSELEKIANKPLAFSIFEFSLDGKKETLFIFGPTGYWDTSTHGMIDIAVKQLSQRINRSDFIYKRIERADVRVELRKNETFFILDKIPNGGIYKTTPFGPTDKLTPEALLIESLFKQVLGVTIVFPQPEPSAL